LDEYQIAALRTALGNEGLSATLAGLPQAISLSVGKIGTALDVGDLKAARWAAHALKGAASNFGAARLAALSGACDTDDISLEEIAARMPGLAEAADQTIAALPTLGLRPSPEG
jgi:HPt (histidine-containing phosphotransfer) domain-containing protein